MTSKRGRRAKAFDTHLGGGTRTRLPRLNKTNLHGAWKRALSAARSRNAGARHPFGAGW